MPLATNSLATRSVAGKARSYSYGLLAETMTKAVRLILSWVGKSNKMVIFLS